MQIKFYNNFFIGIPLPESCLNQYTDFLLQTENRFPYLKISKSKIPHITISFMGEQPQRNIKVIEKIVQKEAPTLKNETLKISGFSFFDNKDTKVLFLEVAGTEMLDKFHQDVGKKIEDRFENTWHDFIPHLTIARVKRGSFDRFEKDRNDIKRHFDSVEFEFGITEVGLFGKDPQKNNTMVKIKNISTF